jgi:hypothetical protein
MDWIDLRACIWRMERSDVRGDVGVVVCGMGEGVREKRASAKQGMSVELRLRVVLIAGSSS